MLDTAIGDTLATINVVREAFGKQPLTELPDARTGDAGDCLYFRALRDIGVESVGTGSMVFSSERAAQTAAALWGTNVHGNTVESPRAVRRVIGAFDNHDLPHLSV
jgi:hypothetical protein